MPVACGRCPLNAHSPAFNGRMQALLWFCTPPGHHPHLPCQRVFWRVFGAVREKGEGDSRSSPTAGSLLPSITMSCRETLRETLREVNGLASAWILQRETQEDNFPGFLLPTPGALLQHAVVLWSGTALIRKSYSGNVFSQKVFTYKTLLILFFFI